MWWVIFYQDRGFNVISIMIIISFIYSLLIKMNFNMLFHHFLLFFTHIYLVLNYLSFFLILTLFGVILIVKLCSTVKTCPIIEIVVFLVCH